MGLSKCKKLLWRPLLGPPGNTTAFATKNKYAKHIKSKVCFGFPEIPVWKSWKIGLEYDLKYACNTLFDRPLFQCSKPTIGKEFVKQSGNHIFLIRCTYIAELT